MSRLQDMYTQVLDNHRRQLKMVWDGIVKQVRGRQLIEDDADWLQQAKNYCLSCKPLDIANYYRRKLWHISGHYLEQNNRPAGYCFIEAQHGMPDLHLDKPAWNSTSAAEQEQQAIIACETAIAGMLTAVQHQDEAGTVQCSGQVQSAVAACNLPTTLQLLKQLLHQHRLLHRTTIAPGTSIAPSKAA